MTMKILKISLELKKKILNKLILYKEINIFNFKVIIVSVQIN